MNKYVAFLRGINVGGHRIIKMDELRKIFSSMGFDYVTTYIQSGNVLFKSNEKDREKLTKKIEAYLNKVLSYDVAVMLRTTSDLAIVINNNPFSKKENDDNLQLYVTFLQAEPSPEVKSKINKLQTEIQDCRIITTEIYTSFEISKSKHPFSNIQIEKLFKLSATTRNWSVVNKIFALSEKL